MQVFWWDEVGMDIASVDIEVPSGLSLSDTMMLIDAKIAASLEDAAFGTYDQKCRETDGVWVMDGKFGRGHSTRTYCHPTDPKLAEDLAERELDAFADEE